MRAPYVSLRILQIVSAATGLLFLIGILIVFLGGPRDPARGTIWFAVVRAYLWRSLVIAVGGVGLAVVLGLLLASLGKRWRWQLGKYR